MVTEARRATADVGVEDEGGNSVGEVAEEEDGMGSLD